MVHAFKNIAIFASGAGSNAKQIIEHFALNPLINVKLIVCNKAEAGVLIHAKTYNIPVLIIEKERFFRGDGYSSELYNASIDFIVLAGFLWKIPAQLVAAYPNRIINIHPALLPAYGGKGMYGKNVHTAVLQAKETQSGISIHYVDDLYDNGDIILQVFCQVDPTDTQESLANKIHQLEHKYYPKVINICIEHIGEKIKLTPEAL